MKTCPSKTYDFSAETADKIANALGKTFGLTLDVTKPSGSGKEPQHGIVFNWTIADSKITIIVISKPWYISCDTIYAHLDAIYEDAVEGHEIKGE